MTGPNEPLEKYLAEHIISDGECSCGWNIANYDIEPYEWEETDKPARRRAWIAHVESVWRKSHPLGKIQQAVTRDPSGEEVVFDMEPGHDTLHEEPRGLGRGYHGEYRYADYEPPPRDPDDCSTPMTCEEAGCRNPHCLGGHFSLSLSIPVESCAGCGKSFDSDDERVAIVMQPPEGQLLETGTAIATTASYHRSCEPSQEELEERAEELWPTPDKPNEEEADEPQQAMACLSCGLAGTVPDDHFPQEPGLWDRPCPECGEEMVWVTEVT